MMRGLQQAATGPWMQLKVSPQDPPTASCCAAAPFPHLAALPAPFSTHHLLPARLPACRSLTETEALVEGVRLLGPSKWAEIKKMAVGGIGELLATRSAVDLKDKWRNLVGGAES